MDKEFRNMFLVSLEEEMERLIIETGTSTEVDFYKALKKIINLHLNEEDVVNRFDEFSDMVISIAKMDFSKRMTLEKEKDFFAHIAVSMNMLSEELQYMAVPRNYLETVLDDLPQPVVITDAEHTILYTNKALEQLLGFDKNELESKPLYSLFTVDFTKGLNAGDKKNNRDVRHHTSALRDKNGMQINVEVVSKPTGNQHLNPNGIIHYIKEAHV